MLENTCRFNNFTLSYLRMRRWRFMDSWKNQCHKNGMETLRGWQGRSLHRHPIDFSWRNI